MASEDMQTAVKVQFYDQKIVSSGKTCYEVFNGYDSYNK